MGHLESAPPFTTPPRATATPSTPPERIHAGSGRFLTFRLNSATYGLPIMDVREVLTYLTPTTIPTTSGDVRGVIELRGRPVPIIDLAQRLQARRTTIQPRTCIVIVDVVGIDSTHLIGFIVDAVDTVLDLASVHIEPAPASDAAPPSQRILGMSNVDPAGLITLLDINCLFSGDEISKLTQCAD